MITDDVQLRELWVSLIDAETFDRRSLWLLFVEHDLRVAPLVVPIDDVPRTPDEEVMERLADLTSQARTELGVGSVPMLLSRPGPREMSDDDRRWGRVLLAAQHGQARRWAAHLATPDGIQAFAADDLMTTD